MSDDSKKMTHRYVAYKDGERTMCWPDDGTWFTEGIVQTMRNNGNTVVWEHIPETASA